MVGSINQDFVLKVDHRPDPGETVTGAELATYPGGKGANQAVAASLLGASVTMLGRVGGDSIGEALLSNLQKRGVNTGYVKPLATASTGAAFITVTPDGENAITVAPGANRQLTEQDVEEAAGTIGGADILIAQLEIPPTVVQRVVEVAAKVGTRAAVNLAPPFELSSGVLGKLDPLVVNEHEAAFLLGEKVRGTKEAITAARGLLSLGVRSVVITLGTEGAVLAEGSSARHVAAPRVKAVDTTGAGDAFAGALVTALAGGRSLEEATSYAVRAGAAAVTEEGAQGALPTLEAVEGL